MAKKNSLILLILIVLIVGFSFLIFVKGEIVLKNLRLFLASTYEIEIPADEVPAGQFNPPTPPEGGFRILINDDAKYTNTPNVTLKLFGGPNTEKMAISNFSDFRDAGQEKYQTSKEWNLCQGLVSCPEGEDTVYAKFYAPWGAASKIVSDSIIYESIKEEVVAEVPEAPPEEILPPEEIPEEIPEEVVEEIPSPPPVGEEVEEKEEVKPKISFRYILVGIIIIILVVAGIIWLIARRRRVEKI